MKLMCVKDGIRDAHINIPVWPEVGNIYTFNRIIPKWGLVHPPADEKTEWWEVKEIMGYCFASDLFAPLSDIDETEFINEKQLVL